MSTLALWDPNTPSLYEARLRLRRKGQVLDTVRTYFGMRKIDFDTHPQTGVPSALRLNGVPRYLRGALYQSFLSGGRLYRCLSRNPEERHRLREEVRV